MFLLVAGTWGELLTLEHPTVTTVRPDGVFAMFAFTQSWRGGSIWQAGR